LMRPSQAEKGPALFYRANLSKPIERRRRLIVAIPPQRSL